MIVVSILDNSIAHAHTYVIVVLCVLVATHEHLPSTTKTYGFSTSTRQDQNTHAIHIRQANNHRISCYPYLAGK